MFRTEVKQFSLDFIRPEDPVPHNLSTSSNFQVFPAKERLLLSNSTINLDQWKPAVLVIPLESLHRISKSRWDLPSGSQSPFSSLLSVFRHPTVGRVLVAPNLFYLEIMEATEFRTFSAAKMFCSFLQIWTLQQSCLWALQTVPLAYLVFALIVTLKAFYKEVRIFPNLTRGRLNRSKCRNIWAEIKRNWRNLR